MTGGDNDQQEDTEGGAEVLTAKHAFEYDQGGKGETRIRTMRGSPFFLYKARNDQLCYQGSCAWTYNDGLQRLPLIILLGPYPQCAPER